MAKKILGGLLLISVVSLSLPKQTYKSIDEANNKNMLLATRHPMHEGRNEYIDVLGWDGSSYFATIQLNYHKNKKGAYDVSPPEFFMVQKYTGITLLVPSLNIINSNEEKVKYTCFALNDSTHPGLIVLKFKKEQRDTNTRAENNYINFDGPMGISWKAFIDSSYTQVSDTSVLLKFTLVKA